MNLQAFTEEEINEVTEEAKANLPEEIRAAIDKSDWTGSIRNLVNKYHLRIDQGDTLEKYVYFTMLGLVKPADLIYVIGELGLDEAQTASLTEEVETSIFDRIKDQVIGGMTEEEKKEFDKPVLDSTVAQNFNAAVSAPSTVRDSLLAEIEKEDVPAAPKVAPNVILPGEMPVTSSIPEPIQPFTFSQDKAVDIKESELGSGITEAMQSTPASTPAPAPAEVVAADPIASGLNKTTATSPSKPVSYSIDPYREPIE